MLYAAYLDRLRSIDIANMSVVRGFGKCVDLESTYVDLGGQIHLCGYGNLNPLQWIWNMQWICPYA